VWYIVVWGVNLLCDSCSQSDRKVRKKKNLPNPKMNDTGKKRKQTLPKKKVNISPLWNSIFKTDSALQSHLANGGKKNITAQGWNHQTAHTHAHCIFI
jgi:hypothetical protein